MRRACSFAVLGISAALLTGCPSSQTWTTPRTIPAGTVQHTAGVEFVGVDWDCRVGDVDCSNPLGFVAVPFPAYQVRIGAADMLDVGLKVSTSGTFGADFKIQLVRSDFFDLAIDPGVTAPMIFAFSYFNFPIMFGLNFSDVMTLTIAPKATYLVVFDQANDFADESAANGLLVGGGVNFQIRVSPRFAITPGVEWLRAVTGDASDIDMTFINFGIGFTFGAFPDFGGGGGQPSEVGPPPA